VEYDPEIADALTRPLDPRQAAIIDKLDTILLPLGPYGNLTTLFGVIVSLHPQMVVLNHAAERLFQFPEIDFLRDCSKEKQRRFLKVSARLLQDGKGGPHGGSILKSHAYQDPRLERMYRGRFGSEMLKSDARVLFWKDSHRIQNHITGVADGMERIAESFKNVKFVLPIRNPIHCVNTNIKENHWRFFASKDEAYFEPLMKKVLANIRWILTHKTLTSDRLLTIWEPNLLSKGLDQLCDFCDIKTDPGWKTSVENEISLRDRATTHEELSTFERLVEQEFRDLPDIRNNLMSLVSG